MPRGDKSKYTGPPEAQGASTSRKATRSAASPKDEAERRAWATVNKEEGGGNKSGSGRGVPDTKSRRARAGGSADARRPAAGCGALALGEEGGGDAQATGVVAFQFGKTPLSPEPGRLDGFGDPRRAPQSANHCIAGNPARARSALRAGTAQRAAIGPLRPFLVANNLQ